MNTFQPLQRPSRSQRAFILALAFGVNAGIAGFIDQLAATDPAAAEMAIAKPAVGAARG